MNTPKLRYILFGLGFFAIIFALFAFVKQPKIKSSGDNVLQLKAPSFVDSVRAENSEISVYLA